MKNQIQIPLIVIAVFSIIILLAQNNLPLVWAVSVTSITFATGTTTNDVDYIKVAEGSGTNSQAYVVGSNAGQAFAWLKPSNSDTAPSSNVTLTGSGSGTAIEYHNQQGYVYVATNDKFYKLSPALSIANQFASGQSASVVDFQYDPINDSTHTLYFCFTDGFGSLNTVTLVPTVLYTDAGTNGIIGCALDAVNGFMYLSGDDIGGVLADLIKVSLSTFTVVDSVTVVNFLFGVCYDTEENFVWAMESSLSSARKYNSDLSLVTSVTVGTTPRNCSISDDTGARRLYVANEGTDNVSIIDIDANVVVTTQSVCDVVGGRKLDTFRGFNTTKTFITCNSNVNSIITDDTVTESPDDQPAQTITICYVVQGSGQTFCKTYDLDENGNVILDSVIGGVNPRNITTTSGELFCSLGITNCDDPDITTNGTGMFMLLILVIISYALIVAIHHIGHKPIGDIHPMLVLLIGIIDVTLAFFLGWIPDFIFYTVIVLMVGLGGFGLYRIIRGL